MHKARYIPDVRTTLGVLLSLIMVAVVIAVMIVAFINREKPIYIESAEMTKSHEPGKAHIIWHDGKNVK